MENYDKIAEKLKQTVNSVLNNELVFKQVQDDPGGYLNSKEHVNEFLIRFVYVNSNNELVLDGEEVVGVDEFLKLADALVEAKYFSDIIDDWDDDSRIVLDVGYAKLLEDYITDKQEDGLVKFFPISAFFYSVDGIIYETDLYNYDTENSDNLDDNKNDVLICEDDVEIQNMVIEDCDENFAY